MDAACKSCWAPQDGTGSPVPGLQSKCCTTAYPEVLHFPHDPVQEGLGAALGPGCTPLLLILI